MPRYPAILSALVVFLVVPAGCGPRRLPPGDVNAGHAVFAEHCLVCHYTNTTENRMGPGLKGLFQWGRLQNGKPVARETVAAQIRDGSQNMPPFRDKLSRRQLADLVAYLKTL